MSKIQKYFLHVDIDAFFASVEQLDHPEWRGKPVIVGGKPDERRSVVSTASYEARKYGVHSAMPSAKAYSLCPQGIFTHARFERYHELSEQIMDILKKYSPEVDQKSIDEATLDLTGTQMLFGCPEEIAVKMQKEVYAQTGLTVSLGLASTPSLAKIASEIKKPNGFFQIALGEEENFMLSMPLEKICGIGKKTLIRLKNAGLFTTKQIHSKSLSFLCIMFGNHMGNFLYNTVRAIETENPKTKKHSISAETTFAYDLNCRYTAETALLELSQTVMFRLLKEKVFTKSIMVKIRYDDFSTFTVSETFQDYIASLDDLYGKVCTLFQKKYETGRRIRLLGICAENIEDEKSFCQESLFDFGEKKKQNLEKTILNLKTKYPGIELKKARLLNDSKKKIKLFLLILFQFIFYCISGLFNVQAAFADENTVESKDNPFNAGTIKLPKSFFYPPLPPESPKSLFDYTLQNKEIEFFASGWWKGELKNAFQVYFGNGTKSVLSSNVPVFVQETDIFLQFIMNKKWYFEAAFADKFSRNKAEAGFRGGENDFLKEIKISNRDIIFPSIYSADIFSKGIGGGNNQAPGIYAHLHEPESERWRADFAVRYDMTSMHSAEFYGKNSVTVKTVELSDYVKGQFFVLPPGMADFISSVYVESPKGTYKDAAGRKYKKINTDEYMVLRSKNQVILSKSAGAGKKNGTLPAAAFEFSKDFDFNEKLGKYEISNSFLGKVQSAFSSKVDLNDFSYEYTVSINGTKMLLVQSPVGFSPFICAFRYDCGISKGADLSIGSKTSEIKNSEYSAVSSEGHLFVSSDFFYETHLYADVFNNNYIQPENSEITAEMRYPFAKKNPEIYLNYDKEQDFALFVKTYTPVNAFNIGTNASGSSVRVYKNGVIDGGAVYEAGSGEVSLSAPISDFDKIYITWNEESNNNQNGAISAEAAFLYNFTPRLKADSALSVNWTLAPRLKFAEYGKPAASSASYSSGLFYKNDWLELSNASLVSLETINSLGIYRILGMENIPVQPLPLKKTNKFLLPENFAPKLNPRPDEKLNSFITLLPENNKTEEKEISSSDAVSLSWNFTKEKNEWAAVNIKLSEQDLSSVSQFGIRLKTDKGTAGYDLYLQLGVSADKDFDLEYKNNIPCWKISDRNAKDVKKHFDPSVTIWQEIEIFLTESDRSKLNYHQDARLIVLKKSSFEGQDTIFSDAYFSAKNSISIASDKPINISAFQEKDNSLPDKNKFNQDNNYIQRINWKKKDNQDVLISAVKYFKEVNVCDYNTLNFFFKCSQNSSNENFSFVLDRDSFSPDEEGKIALKAVIKKDDFDSFNSGEWHFFSINMEDNSVKIDGKRISPELLEINKNVIPSRMLLKFYACNTEGYFCIDELYLEGISPYLSFQDKAFIKIEKQGSILKIGNFPLIENPYFKSQVLSSASIKEGQKNFQSSGVSSLNSAGITAALIKMEADASFTHGEKTVFNSAGHKISSASPILNILSFSENFVFNNADTSYEKKSNATIDLNKFYIPIIVSANVKSQENRQFFKQSAETQAQFKFSREMWEILFKAGAGQEQKKIFSASEIAMLSDLNYFSALKNETEKSFSQGSKNALSRNVAANADFGIKISAAELNPSLKFEILEKYVSSPTVYYSDSVKINTQIPFQAGMNKFTLKYSKEAGGNTPGKKGGNYNQDWQQLKASLLMRDWYLKTLPFNDMFSKELAINILKQTNLNAESLYYSGNYGITWKRPIFADIRDLWIPASAEFNAARDISTASNINDIYQFKLSIVNTPFNLFGKQSYLELFKWYNTDEFAISFTGAVKIPASAPEDAFYSVSCYVQSGFYMNNSGILKGGFQLKAETNNTWSANTAFFWKRNAHMSPIITLIKLFPHIKNTESIKIYRVNSAAVSFSYKNDELSQTYEAGHSLDIKLLKYLTLNLGISSELTLNQNKANRLDVSAQIGGKIQF